MSLKYIYFDLDNTLLDHNKAESRSQQAIYNQFPVLRKVELDDWLDTYKEANHNLWVQYQDGEIDRIQLQFYRFHNSMKNLDLPTDQSEEIGLTYMEKYRDFWDWIEQAEETLATVSRIFNIGIITNGFKETQHKKFEKLSIHKYTDTDRMIISEELGVLKPHPKVFDHATEIAGVKREEILYVGDSYSSDIIGGINAGWKTAWFNGTGEPEEGEPKADLTFNDFHTLQKYLNVG